MADKLTVGRIQQLSDKPTGADLSKVTIRYGKPSGVMVREDQALLDDMAKARAEGYAAGRAEVLALVRKKLEWLEVQVSRQDIRQHGQFWVAIDAFREVLAQETGKEQA